MARGPIPDKPANRPTVPAVRRKAYAFLSEPRHGVGGALHGVLDDGNQEDGAILWSRDYAATGCHCGRKPCQAAVDLCDDLLAMTRTQRAKVIRLARFGV